MAGYACLIISENLQAIASEKPDFDLDSTLEWIDAHEDGYFLRDTSSVFDCKYLDKDVFFEMYDFVDKDRGELFRRVARI